VYSNHEANEIYTSAPVKSLFFLTSTLIPGFLSCHFVCRGSTGSTLRNYFASADRKYYKAFLSSRDNHLSLSLYSLLFIYSYLSFSLSFS
jgi:hypothetical protein